MSRERTKDYHDVYLSDKDINILRNGKTVLKACNSNHYAIHHKQDKLAREIIKLKKKLRELQNGKCFV